MEKQASFAPLYSLLEGMGQGSKIQVPGAPIFGVPSLDDEEHTLAAAARRLEQCMLAFRQKNRIRGSCRAELFRQTSSPDLAYIVLFKNPLWGGSGVKACRLTVEWRGALVGVDLWRLVSHTQLQGVDPAAEDLHTAESLQAYLESKIGGSLERVEPDDVEPDDVVRAASALYLAKDRIVPPRIAQKAGLQTLAVMGTPFLDDNRAIHVDALYRLGTLLQAFLDQKGCKATVRIPGPITRWLPQRGARPKEGPGQWLLANELILKPSHSLYVCGGSDGRVVHVFLDIQERKSLVEFTLLEAEVANSDMIRVGAIDVHDLWGGHHMLGVMMCQDRRLGAESSMACLTKDVLAMIVDLVRQGGTPLLFGEQ